MIITVGSTKLRNLLDASPPSDSGHECLDSTNILRFILLIRLHRLSEQALPSACSSRKQKSSLETIWSRILCLELLFDMRPSQLSLAPSRPTHKDVVVAVVVICVLVLLQFRLCPVIVRVIALF